MPITGIQEIKVYEVLIKCPVRVHVPGTRRKSPIHLQPRAGTSNTIFKNLEENELKNTSIYALAATSVFGVVPYLITGEWYVPHLNEESIKKNEEAI